MRFRGNPSTCGRRRRRIMDLRAIPICLSRLRLASRFGFPTFGSLPARGLFWTWPLGPSHWALIEAKPPGASLTMTATGVRFEVVCGGGITIGSAIGAAGSEIGAACYTLAVQSRVARSESISASACTNKQFATTQSTQCPRVSFTVGAFTGSLNRNTMIDLA